VLRSPWPLAGVNGSVVGAVKAVLLSDACASLSSINLHLHMMFAVSMQKSLSIKNSKPSQALRYCLPVGIWSGD
jgi:hypothetical protein